MRIYSSESGLKERASVLVKRSKPIEYPHFRAITVFGGKDAMLDFQSAIGVYLPFQKCKNIDFATYVFAMKERPLPQSDRLFNGGFASLNPEPGFNEASGTSPPRGNWEQTWHIYDPETKTHVPIQFPNSIPDLTPDQLQCGFQALVYAGVE